MSAFGIYYITTQSLSELVQRPNRVTLSYLKLAAGLVPVDGGASPKFVLGSKF
jgi:hypothetical protein